jgi:hypothetical protein
MEAMALAKPVRPQKITFADMRAHGVRGWLIYCADYWCSHSSAPQTTATFLAQANNLLAHDNKPS